MKRRHRYETFFQFLALAVFYTIGMNTFMFLKLLGLSELQATTEAQRRSMLPFSALMAFGIALSIGVLEAAVFPKWSHFSFRKYVLAKYALIILTILIGTTFIYVFSVMFGSGVSVGEALKSLPVFLRSELFLSLFIYLLLFSIFLNTFTIVLNHLGPQALLGAFFGRYHQPLEEDRTFIFIDLQSSTTLAEKLGHVQYSLFIERCFRLLTDCIYEYKASLYQFVGDEAVLSWTTERARRTMAPLHIYYSFAAKLEADKEQFKNLFGEVPHFKAAVHSGTVSVTKIRSTKMDVVYHGDVLNTCARIMGECSRLKKDLLVSSEVAKWLENDASFSTSYLESLQLRGKETETQIYEVKKAEGA